MNKLVKKVTSSSQALLCAGPRLDPDDLRRFFLIFIILGFCESTIFHGRALSLNMKQIVINIIFKANIIREVSWVEDRN